MKRTRQTQGFTLVELLVVMAIVAVLASLLFTVFSRVREKGRSAVCQSNLKQIAVAMQQYVQSNDGRYPSVKYDVDSNTTTSTVFRWFDAITPYTKSPAVFQCPTRKAVASDDMSIDIHYLFNEIQLNGYTVNPTSRTLYRGSHESKPLLASTVVLNLDKINHEPSPLSFATSIDASCGRVGIPTLHSGGANYSFVDGHVKWFSPAKQGEVHCEFKRTWTLCSGSPNGCP